MKKSLLAVAALGAFASAAQAQSSVTVYGILDVGYIGSNSTQSISNATAAQGYTQGVKKQNTSQFGDSAEQSSRLGFRGTEDLGGGTQAVFTTEFSLYPSQETTSGNTYNGLFNRQTFVGLHKNGVGQVSAGLQYTTVFDAVALTDVGQLNNMMGNVIYAYSSGGAGNAGAGTSQIGFTSRAANSLKLNSDSFAGFRVNGMLTSNNQNTTLTTTGSGTNPGVGGNNNGSGWGLGADYTYNKFFVTAAYQALKALNSTTNTDSLTAGVNTGLWTYAQAGGATAASTASGFAGTTTAPLNSALTSATANNIQDNQTYAAATYDFGILKAYAQYINRKATSTIDTSYYAKRSAEQIGVRSFITPTVEGWASAGLGRYTAFGQNAPTANFNAWQLGSNYWLSKRTNLYAIYGQTITSNAATSAGVTASYSANNYAIGVRHTF